MADDAFHLVDKLAISSPRLFTGTGNVVMGNGGVLCVKKSVAAVTTVTLTARCKGGEVAIVKDSKGDAATRNITIQPDGTTNNTTIDGAATIAITTNYGAAILLHNGSEWCVIASR